ncbi:inverted formin-2 [Plakobranchus ocellatus]|uniref:Inverted formin-2 n=1 Tax=Plakobranchus ocellatus TaxID=259542 RepID=A0AAV3ZFH9_9GAST|nr:inverted formin-2 [Plakobranchus ocellatus]
MQVQLFDEHERADEEQQLPGTRGIDLGNPLDVFHAILRQPRRESWRESYPVPLSHPPLRPGSLKCDRPLIVCVFFYLWAAIGQTALLTYLRIRGLLYCTLPPRLPDCSAAVTAALQTTTRARSRFRSSPPFPVPVPSVMRGPLVHGTGCGDPTLAAPVVRPTSLSNHQDRTVRAGPEPGESTGTVR